MTKFTNLSSHLSISKTNSPLNGQVAFCSVSNLCFFTCKVVIVVVSSQHRVSHIKKSLIIFNISSQDIIFLTSSILIFMPFLKGFWLLIFPSGVSQINQLGSCPLSLCLQLGPNYFLKDQDKVFFIYIIYIVYIYFIQSFIYIK